MDKFNLTIEEVKKVPRTSGIYRIHCFNVFKRLRGETDIVYIGKAEGKALRSRIRSVITGKGRKAWPRFEKLKESDLELLFSFVICDDPETEESKELKTYEEKHLELPPLNHSG